MTDQPKPLTTEEIEAIGRRLEKTTDGPWDNVRVGRPGNGRGEVVRLRGAARRVAEEMREKAAQIVDKTMTTADAVKRTAKRIRSLPLPDAAPRIPVEMLERAIDRMRIAAGKANRESDAQTDEARMNYSAGQAHGLATAIRILNEERDR